MNEILLHECEQPGPVPGAVAGADLHSFHATPRAVMSIGLMMQT